MPRRSVQQLLELAGQLGVEKVKLLSEAYPPAIAIAVVAQQVIEHCRARPDAHALVDLLRESLDKALEQCTKDISTRLMEEGRDRIELLFKGLRNKELPFWQELQLGAFPVVLLRISPAQASEYWPTVEGFFEDLASYVEDYRPGRIGKIGRASCRERV